MSESNSKSVLEDMIKSVITRDGKGTADTMLISSHLSQMKMFGIRQGVEYYPMQDNLGTQRFDFIQQVIKFNQLDARLDACLLYTSPSPRDGLLSRMPSSA